MIFKCAMCAEKEKHIAYLQELVKDLHDRLMSRDFGHYAFVKKAQEQPAQPAREPEPVGIVDPETGEVF